MSAFTRANPLGWSTGNPVTAAQMNALDLDHVKTINAVDGAATYNPAGLIQIGGAGFQWNATSAFASTSETSFVSGATIDMQGALNVTSPGAIYLLSNGRIIVQNTGEIAVQTGGELVIESGGEMTFEGGSLTNVEDGATVQWNDGSVSNFGGIVNFGVTSEIFGAPRLASSATFTAQSGSTIAAASGSTVTLSGTTTFANSTNPQLSPARTWTRHSTMRIAAGVHTMDLDTGVVTAYTAYNAFPANDKGAALYVRNDGDPDARTWIELDDLPHGQTISQVVLRTNYSGDPGTIERDASYKIVRWNDEDDYEDMSASVDDSHTEANWGTVVAQTITINAHATIDRAYRYALHISPHDVTVDRRLVVFSCVASGTASSLVV